MTTLEGSTLTIFPIIKLDDAEPRNNTANAVDLWRTNYAGFATDAACGSAEPNPF